jgi:hypothetical protein
LEATSRARCQYHRPLAEPPHRHYPYVNVRAKLAVALGIGKHCVSGTAVRVSLDSGPLFDSERRPVVRPDSSRSRCATGVRHRAGSTFLVNPVSRNVCMAMPCLGADTARKLLYEREQPFGPQRRAGWIRCHTGLYRVASGAGRRANWSPSCTAWEASRSSAYRLPNSHGAGMPIWGMSICIGNVHNPINWYISIRFHLYGSLVAVLSKRRRATLPLMP